MSGKSRGKGFIFPYLLATTHAGPIYRASFVNVGKVSAMRLLKFPHATEPIEDVKAFRRDVRQMRKAFPAPCRVYVQLVPSGQLIIDGERVHSYINPLPNSWQILIEQNEHMSNCFYSLCHEWAHALAPPGSRKSHHTRFRDLHHKIVYHFIPDA